MMEKHFELEFLERDFDKFTLRQIGYYNMFAATIRAFAEEESFLSRTYLHMDTVDNFFNKIKTTWKQGNSFYHFLKPNFFIKSYRKFDKNAIVKLIWDNFYNFQASSLEHLPRKAASIFTVFGIFPFGDYEQNEQPIRTHFSFRPHMVYEIEGLGNERKTIFNPDYEPPNTRDFFIRLEYELTFACGSTHFISSPIGSPERLRAYYKNEDLYVNNFAYSNKFTILPIYNYNIIYDYHNHFLGSVVGENKYITLLNLSYTFQIHDLHNIFSTESEEKMAYKCSPTIRHRKTDWSVVKQNIFDI